MDDSLERATTQQESEKSRRRDFELYHDGVLGRCPECGRLIMLPCLACRIGEIEMDDPDAVEESEFELELNEAERQRYRQVRNHRVQYGISMFDKTFSFVKTDGRK